MAVRWARTVEKFRAGSRSPRELNGGVLGVV
jgi:hypothetical protein